LRNLYTVSPHSLWVCLSADFLEDAAVKHDMDHETGHAAGDNLLYSPDSSHRQHQTQKQQPYCVHGSIPKHKGC